MYRLFLILSLILSAKCFSYDEYIFSEAEQYSHFDSRSHTHYVNRWISIYGIEKEGNRFFIGTTFPFYGKTKSYAYKAADRILSTHRVLPSWYGAIFDRFKEFEVYDENNHLIGFIESSYEENSAALFFFYKKNKELFAKVSLDLSLLNLTITSPDDQILLIGTKASCIPVPIDSSESSYTTISEWNIKKMTNQPFDARFLWPFMNFLRDVWDI